MDKNDLQYINESRQKIDTVLYIKNSISNLQASINRSYKHIDECEMMVEEFRTSISKDIEKIKELQKQLKILEGSNETTN